MKKTSLHSIIITTVISIFFYACNEKENKVVVVKNIDFKTGFVEIEQKFKGLYYDKNLKQETVYFSDREKVLKTYSLQGELLDSVPLTNVVELFGSKLGFAIPYSKDTIFCGQYDSMSIAAIDHTGNIYHKVTVDALLPDSLKDLVLAYRMLPYQLSTSNKILFRNFLPHDALMEKENKTDLDVTEQTKYFYETFIHTPYFLELDDIFSDTPKYRFGLHDYYKNNFAEDDASMAFSFYFKEMNNFIFLLCSATGKIFKIDPETFEIVKEIEVKSKFTDLKNTYTYMDLLNSTEVAEASEYKGVIAELFYDEKINKYLAVVLHSVKNREEYNRFERFNYRPFSIIAYDANFENPVEYNFEGNTYNARISFMCSEGFMIQRKPENLTVHNYGTQTFDLLKFN
ncbi:MAG: hypothetical protein LBV41_05770 [Cytophagaceae bacterium]|jgi:hypothetical protein|nr:hypothetical protein [Cytophagaceae bacterium]